MTCSVSKGHKMQWVARFWSTPSEQGLFTCSVHRMAPSAGRAVRGGLYLMVDPSALGSKRQAWRAKLTAKSRREDFSQCPKSFTFLSAPQNDGSLSGTFRHHQEHLPGWGRAWVIPGFVPARLHAATTRSLVVTHVTVCLILLYTFEWYQNHLIPKTTQSSPVCKEWDWITKK